MLNTIWQFINYLVTPPNLAGSYCLMMLSATALMLTLAALTLVKEGIRWLFTP
jgi:hypothetical protein